jgi:hypothetical protein
MREREQQRNEVHCLPHSVKRRKQTRDKNQFLSPLPRRKEQKRGKTHHYSLE